MLSTIFMYTITMKNHPVVITTWFTDTKYPYLKCQSIFSLLWCLISVLYHRHTVDRSWVSNNMEFGGGGSYKKLELAVCSRFCVVNALMFCIVFVLLYSFCVLCPILPVLLSDPLDISHKKTQKAQRVTRITFSRYVQDQKIGKPNNINVFGGIRIKVYNEDNQNRRRRGNLRGENLRFDNNYVINDKYV